MLNSDRSLALNEYLPLKQGLRLFTNLALHHFLAHNEYLPLKQGLRHLTTLKKTKNKTTSMSIFH